MYAGAVHVSLRGLRRLVGSGSLSASKVVDCCMLPYWSGGLLLTAGAALNPESPWLMLTSGAAVGFGAMVGLVLLPRLLRSSPQTIQGHSEPLGFTWPWLLSGAVAAVVFVGIFGPGLRLTSR